jgi:exopolysaccharide production protein ExoZ
MSLTRPPQFAEVRAGQAPASAAAFRNPWIQSLRGVAALFVTLYHASYDVYLLGDAGWAAVFDGRFGLIGVAIFSRSPAC